MKRYGTWLSVLGAGVLAIGTLVALAKEQRVSLDQVPAKAREALLKAAGGAAIQEIEKEVENGVVVYEATWLVDGKEQEAKVTADGMAVKDDDEDEEDEGEEESEKAITIEEVPAKARDAIMKLAGGATITEVSREKEAGVELFEAVWIVNGLEHSVEVTADGALVKIEEVVEARDVPEAVQKVAAKMLSGAEKVTFEKKTVVMYEVKGKVAGKKREIKISPAGKVAKHKGKHKDDDDDDEEEGEEHGNER